MYLHLSGYPKMHKYSFPQTPPPPPPKIPKLPKYKIIKGSYIYRFFKYHNKPIWFIN